MVAVFLFVGGAVIAFIEGLERVRHPHEDESGLAFSLAVLAFAAIFEYFVAFGPALRQFNKTRSGRSLRATFREGKDPALLVVVFEDTAALVGVFIAAAGLLLARYTHWPQWDGIASLLISFLLAGVAIFLAYEMKQLLVGESASREDRSAIRAATLSIKEVSSIGRLLTMQLSPTEVLVNMDVHLDDGLTTDEVEAVIDKIEESIVEEVPEATRIFIELEPGL